MSNVVRLDIMTLLELTPELVIEAAVNHGLKDVVIIGRDHDGKFYCAGSTGDGGTTILMLELAKKLLLDCLQ